MQGDLILRRRAPHVKYSADRFSFDSRAALSPVAHAARGHPPPYDLGPTMEDFPPKIRGPASWLSGGLGSVRCRLWLPIGK